MLSEVQLAAIYAPKASRRKASKGRAFVRGNDGIESVVITKMGDFDLGKHVGKVGSMRRSRKGQSRRMPNGRRSYQPRDYDTNGVEVVAYSLAKR